MTEPTQYPDLSTVRDKIDEIDQEIIRLLEQRLQLAGEVARIKEREAHTALTDPKREQEIIERLQQSTNNQVLRGEVENIFKICMEMSKRVRIIRQQQEKNRYLPALKLGIIGHGNFGALLHTTFSTYWPQSLRFVYEPHPRPQHPTLHSLEETCQTDLLFLCVPISKLTEALKTIRPHLGEQTTVVDVCAVKQYAAEQMQQILGPNARLIACHPMFGPQSTRQGTDFFGLNLVAHNLSAPAFVYDVFIQFWKNMGVHVVELSPEEHDRLAAYSINYNHLMGRIGEHIGIQSTPIDTKGFQVIFDALQYVTHDTWELFCDMQRYNPFAHKMREEVRAAIAQIEARIQGHDNA